MTKIKIDDDVEMLTDKQLKINILKFLDEYRDILKAVTHIDGSARLQTVGESGHKLFYDILTYMDSINMVPVILNTSFNINEPIVCNPMDALNTFHKSDIDYLVIQNFIFKKSTNFKAVLCIGKSSKSPDLAGLFCGVQMA